MAMMHTAALCLPFCACGGPAYEQGTPSDTVGVLRAVVAWADTFEAPGSAVPLVIVDRPSEMRPPPPAIFRGRPEPLPVTHLPLNSIDDGTGAGRMVKLCAQDDGDRGPGWTELCATRPPWRVIVLSVPHIVGDSAVVYADLFDVIDKYDGGAPFALLIERRAAGWTVIARDSRGIYD